MKRYIYVFFIVVLCSCNAKNKDIDWTVKNTKDIQMSSVQLDTIHFDKINSSFVGDIWIKSDSIYFVDKRFCWVFSFDKDGKLGKRYLGKGAAPSEISTGIIDAFTPMSDGGSFFVGANNDCHLFSKNFIKNRSFRLDKGPRDKSDINLNDFSIYTLMYPKLIFKEHDGDMFFNQYCDHPKSNYIVNSDYYKDAKLISRMNMKSGKVDSMFASYPKMYDEKTLNQFNLFCFDIANNGDFYFCFEADPLIYKYDSDLKPMYAFGYPAEDMNTDYKCLKSYATFRKGFTAERNEKSFYDWIEYIDDLDLLFRSCSMGDKHKYDALQIYRGDSLIANVSVPKGFRVMGYIKPYIYSNILIDEENETMKIYRLNPLKY